MAGAVTGAENVKRLLRELGSALSKPVLQKNLREAAQPIADEARNLVPKKTGELTKSITVENAPTDDNTQDAAVLVGIKTGKGFAGWRAHFIEFGTSKMAARPFMRPAYDTKIGECRNLIEQKLGTVLAKVIKKGG